MFSNIFSYFNKNKLKHYKEEAQNRIQPQFTKYRPKKVYDYIESYHREIPKMYGKSIKGPQLEKHRAQLKQRMQKIRKIKLKQQQDRKTSRALHAHEILKILSTRINQFQSHSKNPEAKNIEIQALKMHIKSLMEEHHSFFTKELADYVLSERVSSLQNKKQRILNQMMQLVEDQYQQRVKQINTHIDEMKLANEIVDIKNQSVINKRNEQVKNHENTQLYGSQDLKLGIQQIPPYSYRKKRDDQLLKYEKKMFGKYKQLIDSQSEKSKPEVTQQKPFSSFFSPPPPPPPPPPQQQQQSIFNQSGSIFRMPQPFGNQNQLKSSKMMLQTQKNAFALPSAQQKQSQRIFNEQGQPFNQQQQQTQTGNFKKKKVQNPFKKSAQENPPPPGNIFKTTQTGIFNISRMNTPATGIFNQKREFQDLKFKSFQLNQQQKVAFDRYEIVDGEKKLIGQIIVGQDVNDSKQVSSQSEQYYNRTGKQIPMYKQQQFERKRKEKYKKSEQNFKKFMQGATQRQHIRIENKLKKWRQKQMQQQQNQKQKGAVFKFNQSDYKTSKQNTHKSILKNNIGSRINDKSKEKKSVKFSVPKESKSFVQNLDRVIHYQTSQPQNDPPQLQNQNDHLMEEQQLPLPKFNGKNFHMRFIGDDDDGPQSDPLQSYLYDVCKQYYDVWKEQATYNFQLKNLAKLGDKKFYSSTASARFVFACLRKGEVIQYCYIQAYLRYFQGVLYIKQTQLRKKWVEKIEQAQQSMKDLLRSAQAGEVELYTRHYVWVILNLTKRLQQEGELSQDQAIFIKESGISWYVAMFPKVVVMQLNSVQARAIQQMTDQIMIDFPTHIIQSQLELVDIDSGKYLQTDKLFQTFDEAKNLKKNIPLQDFLKQFKIEGIMAQYQAWNQRNENIQDDGYGSEVNNKFLNPWKKKYEDKLQERKQQAKDNFERMFRKYQKQQNKPFQNEMNQNNEQFKDIPRFGGDPQLNVAQSVQNTAQNDTLSAQTYNQIKQQMNNSNPLGELNRLANQLNFTYNPGTLYTPQQYANVGVSYNQLFNRGSQLPTMQNNQQYQNNESFFSPNQNYTSPIYSPIFQTNAIPQGNQAARTMFYTDQFKADKEALYNSNMNINPKAPFDYGIPYSQMRKDGSGGKDNLNNFIVQHQQVLRKRHILLKQTVKQLVFKHLKQRLDILERNNKYLDNNGIQLFISSDKGGLIKTKADADRYFSNKEQFYCNTFLTRMKANGNDVPLLSMIKYMCILEFQAHKFLKFKAALLQREGLLNQKITQSGDKLVPISGTQMYLKVHGGTSIIKYLYNGKYLTQQQMKGLDDDQKTKIITDALLYLKQYHKQIFKTATEKQIEEEIMRAQQILIKQRKMN